MQPDPITRHASRSNRKRQYVHDQQLLASKRDEKRQERLKQERCSRENFEQESEIEDPLAESFMEQMEEIAAEPRLLHEPEVLIENVQKSDLKVFDLAYLKGRWELQTEPETEYERLWFEYALGVAPQGDSR